ncbi:MAG: nuclear pore complex subunit [Bacteroidetes bacterium]|nr:DUF1987 domain-containing protein [Bacteroidia bacterium]PCH69928.1 MAG: nuclear pore complex subunit [Bacteroidota bacterium]
MNPIFQPSTRNTPQVNFDHDKGLIEMKGRSIIEMPDIYYRPLLEWVKKYSENPPAKTTAIFNIEYLNSGSHTALQDILLMLNEINKEGHEVQVKWYYEEVDEYIKEIGLEFETSLSLPIELIEIKEE